MTFHTYYVYIYIYIYIYTHSFVDMVTYCNNTISYVSLPGLFIYLFSTLCGPEISSTGAHGFLNPKP